MHHEFIEPKLIEATRDAKVFEQAQRRLGDRLHTSVFLHKQELGVHSYDAPVAWQHASASLSSTGAKHLSGTHCTAMS
jgi:hypothetical protein